MLAGPQGRHIWQPHHSQHAQLTGTGSSESAQETARRYDPGDVQQHRLQSTTASSRQGPQVQLFACSVQKLSLPSDVYEMCPHQESRLCECPVVKSVADKLHNMF